MLSTIKVRFHYLEDSKKNDESLKQTAIRETKEEVGIDPNTIMNLGSLTPFFIPVTGYIVHPFIGWCKEKPLTQVHDVEVHQLFSVSIAGLLDESILKTRNGISADMMQLFLTIILINVKFGGLQLLYYLSLNLFYKTYHLYNFRLHFII